MHLMWNGSKNQSVLAGVCPCVNLDSQQNHIKTQNFVKHLKVHQYSALICMPKASAVVSGVKHRVPCRELKGSLKFQSKHEAGNDIKSSPRPTTIFYCIITLETHMSFTHSSYGPFLG